MPDSSCQLKGKFRIFEYEFMRHGFHFFRRGLLRPNMF
jgi:hypothetical protein